MTFSVIIVAAGSGSRAGPGLPKVWRRLAGIPVVAHSAQAFARAGAVEIVVVVGNGWELDAQRELQSVPRCRIVVGGATRAASVRAGLDRIEAAPNEIVMIHDGARPFVTAAHIQRLLAALETSDGGLLAMPVADTLKRAEVGVTSTVSRDGLWRAQTPQAFRIGLLRAGYEAWSSDKEPTDDAAVVEAISGQIALVVGDPMLMKLTFPEDFEMAERLVGTARIPRVGQGLDAHRWGPGVGVWLCGVHIDHDQSLVGHSDADAGLHALTDALLGAIGEGDIGHHFPPTDSKWRGAASDQFLAFAVQRIADRGGRILNADVTLVCEQPKISPHRERMRARLAELMQITLDRVSVKATTMEGMGFTGRGEGLLAQAIVSVDMPA
jgi:2-C-methyl-D-erythritol 4-phosphate cytidylyltransferase / 2-C-methyl-D-erythritol 2,4-cyclodiphosphate synthase